MTRGIFRAAMPLAALLMLVSLNAAGQDALPDAPSATEPAFSNGFLPSPCLTDLCTAIAQPVCCQPSQIHFEQFVAGAAASHLMTRRQKLLLAGRDTIDPFNILTILGTSAINIASDPDTTYGPGLKGFARNSGVVFAEGVTGEFFGTFLIPSIARQDPRYHRMPNASTRRRIAHALYQVVWTQSDSGKPMFNYATVCGTIASDAVNDLYVPGRKLGPGASGARIGTAIATDPIDNFISEFLPDLASHVNFRVVFVQRIVNRVALEEGRNSAPD